jgi:cbb3-type cytochrome oxidase subunit 3
MSNSITTGHWIFAATFTLLFLGVLAWSYRKDRTVHQPHFGGSFRILLGIVLLLFVVFIFKRVV